MSKLISLIFMLATLSLIPSVHAHYVWLERDGDGPARAYLGEWIDDIREKTGGMLDRIKAPKVFLGASTEPLPVKRNENNLEFEVKGRGDVRLVENTMPPREDKEKGGATLCQGRTERNRGQARLGAGTHRAQRQCFNAHFPRRAAAKGRGHPRRSVQVAEALGHRRQGPTHSADALGWPLRLGSHPLR